MKKDYRELNEGIRMIKGQEDKLTYISINLSNIKKMLSYCRKSRDNVLMDPRQRLFNHLNNLL